MTCARRGFRNSVKVRTAALAIALCGIGVCSIALASSAGAQDDEPIRALLQKIEQAVRSGDPDRYVALAAENADRTRASDFATLEFRRGTTGVVLLERDRAPVTDALGAGLNLIVDVFIEFGDQGRIATWQLHLQKTATDGWRVANQQRLSAVENLYRSFLNPAAHFSARNFTIRAEDLDLTLDRGSVFTLHTDHGITGLVLLGQGTMRFHPAPQLERKQVAIFAGSEALETRFEAAYVRLGSLALHADMSQLTARPVDPLEFKRAELVFEEESAKSFALDLSDFTSHAWTQLPDTSDFLAEVRTRRFGTLTYSRSASAPEDISVFDRRRQKNIALYASADRLAAPAPFVSQDTSTQFDVRDYEIDLAFDPARHWMDGRAQLDLTIGPMPTSQIRLSLAPSLVVTSVTSRQFGRLFSVRVKNQDTLLITLPALLLPDTDVALAVTYSGPLAPEPADWEMLAMGQRDSLPPRHGDPWQDLESLTPQVIRREPGYLYSSRTSWYPRPARPDYATGTLRITIPAAFECIASGELTPESPTPVDEAEPTLRRKRLVFTVERPLRYLSFFVTRLSSIARATVVFSNESAGVRGPAMSGAAHHSLNLSVLAHAELVSRARDLADRTSDIARFYGSMIGDSPYSSFTVALIEGTRPSGHSPGYFALLNQPPFGQPRTWRDDPAAFDRYADFFPAHEVAHQWWGQAVGWSTYHDQWLSEGFAQYFATLYVGHQRGDEAFRSILGDMRKWAMRESDQGPVYLGYRLGHVRSDGRIFRALVYDKGAAVLHMLRRFIGDEAFFLGLRRFYANWRFHTAGTEDLRRAMEAESGRSLERFFERWIYGWTLPQLKFSYRVEGTPGNGAGREVVLRVDQTGEIFDVPVTVLLQYADRAPVEVVVAAADHTTELRIPIEGAFRRADVRDDGTLADIRKN